MSSVVVIAESEVEAENELRSIGKRMPRIPSMVDEEDFRKWAEKGKETSS